MNKVVNTNAFYRGVRDSLCGEFPAEQDGSYYEGYENPSFGEGSALDLFFLFSNVPRKYFTDNEIDELLETILIEDSECYFQYPSPELESTSGVDFYAVSGESVAIIHVDGIVVLAYKE